MIFIGIVTDAKSEEDISKLLTYNKLFKENNVIFIKETNIDNIKNVHFDTIILNTKFKKMDKLLAVLINAKNIIVNMDEEIDFEDVNITNLNLITYGFNSKSSITISSVTDDEVLICVQRNIYNDSGIIEMQEIKIENNENYSIYDLIVVLTLFLLYLPKQDKININGIK